MAYKIFSVLITFVLIFMYLELRLHRTIIEIPLTESHLRTFHYYFLFLYLLSLGIIISILVIEKFKYKNNTFFSKYIKILDNYNIFFITYGILFKFLSPNYSIYLMVFTRKFVKYSKKTYKIIIIILVALPRIFVSLLLCYEVFFLNCLHYYFYSLLLLLIPLLFRIFIFMLKDLIPRALPEIENFFVSGEKQFPEELDIRYALKKEFSHLDIEDLFHNFYAPLLSLRRKLETIFLPYYNKMRVWCLLYYYIIQTVVWGYVLLQ